MSIDYQELPHFPATTVAGHRGRLLVGRAAVRRPDPFLRRPSDVAGGVPGTSRTRWARRRSNAAGGINPEFSPGTIMLIRDHIDLTGTSSLIGPNARTWPAPFRSRTPTTRSCAILRGDRAASGIPVAEGVYVAMIRRQYETDAELRMLGRLRANARGDVDRPRSPLATRACACSAFRSSRTRPCPAMM